MLNSDLSWVTKLKPINNKWTNVDSIYSFFKLQTTDMRLYFVSTSSHTQVKAVSKNLNGKADQT